MLTIRSLLAAAAIWLVLVPASAAAAKLQVVTSFSILTDLVSEVGGARVTVTALVGPDADMHAFQPTPAHARMLAGADLVVFNGLGFEGWADRLVQASGYKGATVIAATGVQPLRAEGDAHGHGHRHGNGRTQGDAPVDPHAWQQPGNVRLYVGNIRDALIAADPAGEADYKAAAQAYLAKIDVLDAEIRQIFAAIPPARRRAITSHDAFAYFARAYGLTFLAPQGATGDSEPTAKDVAALIRQIRRETIKAVFVENISNPRMIARIAKEAGATLGGTLYSDALSGPGGPAGSYLAMMRHNTRLFVDAMK